MAFGRLACAAVLLAVLTPAPARAFAPSDRVFTVAGGGDRRPVEGASATERRVAPTALTVADDGTIVMLDDGRLWALGSDGRLRSLALAPDAVDDVDAEPGGALLAVAAGSLYRLLPGAADWEVLFTPPPAVAPASRAAQAQRVTHAADGHILVGGTYLSWILETDGSVLETIKAGGSEGAALLRDGTVALLTNYGGLYMRRPGGRLRQDDRRFDAAVGDLLALSDGSLLVAYYDDLFRVDTRLSARPYFAPEPRLGNGDGGSLLHAQVRASALAATPGGELVVADRTAALLRGRFVMEAFARPGGWVTALDDGANLVRIITPDPGPRAVAAITPATYRTLASAIVSYRSTLAGAARLTLDGGPVVRFTARVGPGRVRLPRRPLPGDHRLALTIQDGGRTITARLAVSTRRRLDRRRARALLRDAARGSGDGDATEGVTGSIRDCTVHGPRRLDCGLWLTPYSSFEPPDPPFCAGIWSARQRPDGLRFALLRARRGSHCREPAPAVQASATSREGARSSPRR
jgi:hypothetical protein